MPEPLVSIRGLKTYFFIERGMVKAVDGVDLDIEKGEIFGLVGETSYDSTNATGRRRED